VSKKFFEKRNFFFEKRNKPRIREIPFVITPFEISVYLQQQGLKHPFCSPNTQIGAKDNR
jgi:hypothetical protein